MKKRLTEQEITKQMLATINEGEFGSDVVDGKSYSKIETTTNDNGEDEEELSAPELSEEQQGFRDAVSPRVEFTSFKVYPKNKNVVFSGKFNNLGGLEWQFTLEDADGLYISAENVQMTNDSVNTIKKLKGYYDNWADDWAKKIATEYNRNSEDENEDFHQSTTA